MTDWLAPACAVCFGDPESPLSKGVIAGVAFLIGVIATVLVGIAYTAFVWARRSRHIGGGRS